MMTPLCPIHQPVLRLGSSGLVVMNLQDLLNYWLSEFGMSSERLPATGYFGERTRNVVQYLQCVAFLRADGIVGAKTWAFLCNGPRSLPQLSFGSTDPAVWAVQDTIRRLGCDIPIDGMFGTETEAAVQDLQRAARLKPDGIIGTQTWLTLIQSRMGSPTCQVLLHPFAVSQVKARRTGSYRDFL